MNSNRKVKRTAVPTQDPDSDVEETRPGVELQSIAEDTTLEESKPFTKRQATKFDTISQKAVQKLEANTKAILFPAYIITAALSAIIVVICYFNVTSDLAGLLIILVLTIITAYISMYGVYKWGAVDEWIDFQQKQNALYQKSTDRLKQTRKDLSKHVNSMEQSVDDLHQETIELNQTIESFDQLKDELQGIVSDNEEVMDIVDALNQRYADLKMLANQADQAQLLLMYYKMQFGGANRNRFERDDYEKFIARLNNSTRELYDNFGGFDALDMDKDGNVDPEEFIQITEKVLQRTETHFVELEKQKTLSMEAMKSRRMTMRRR